MLYCTCKFVCGLFRNHARGATLFFFARQEFETFILACAKPLRKLGIFPCARARVFLIEIRTTYQHHRVKVIFEAAKVLIMLIPGVLGTATRPLMPVHLIDTTSKSKAVALLHAHWKPPAIANKIHCHPSTVYRWESNIQKHGHPNPRHPLPCGRPRSIHTAAKNSVLEYVR